MPDPEGVDFRLARVEWDARFSDRWYLIEESPGSVTIVVGSLSDADATLTVTLDVPQRSGPMFFEPGWRLSSGSANARSRREAAGPVVLNV
jgi:hypothetical protein